MEAGRRAGRETIGGGFAGRALAALQQVRAGPERRCFEAVSVSC